MGRSAVVGWLTGFWPHQTDQRRHVVTNLIVERCEGNSATCLAYLLLVGSTRATVALESAGLYRTTSVARMTRGASADSMRPSTCRSGSRRSTRWNRGFGTCSASPSRTRRHVHLNHRPERERANARRRLASLPGRRVGRGTPTLRDSFAEALRSDLQAVDTGQHGVHVLPFLHPEPSHRRRRHRRLQREPRLVCGPSGDVQFDFDDATAAMEAQQSGPAWYCRRMLLAAADSDRMSAFVADEHVVFENDERRRAVGCADPSKAAPVKMIVLNWKRDRPVVRSVHRSLDQAACSPRDGITGQSWALAATYRATATSRPAPRRRNPTGPSGGVSRPTAGSPRSGSPLRASMKHDLSSQRASRRARSSPGRGEVHLPRERMSAFLAQETRVDLTR